MSVRRCVLTVIGGLITIRGPQINFGTRPIPIRRAPLRMVDGSASVQRVPVGGRLRQVALRRMLIAVSRSELTIISRAAAPSRLAIGLGLRPVALRRVIIAIRRRLLTVISRSPPDASPLVRHRLGPVALCRVCLPLLCSALPINRGVPPVPPTLVKLRRLRIHLGSAPLVATIMARSVITFGFRGVRARARVHISLGQVICLPGQAARSRCSDELLTGYPARSSQTLKVRHFYSAPQIACPAAPASSLELRAGFFSALVCLDALKGCDGALVRLFRTGDGREGSPVEGSVAFCCRDRGRFNDRICVGRTVERRLLFIEHVAAQVLGSLVVVKLALMRVAAVLGETQFGLPAICRGNRGKVVVIGGGAVGVQGHLGFVEALLVAVGPDLFAFGDALV